MYLTATVTGNHSSCGTGMGRSACLHNRESVIQGNNLAMIAYGIGTLSLINNLKHEIPEVTQPWYADNARALGTFERLETYFDSITGQGPGQGYHPKPSKSVLIVRPGNIEAGNVLRRRHRFKVCTGTRYLGVYTRDDESNHVWRRERTLTW